MSYRKYDEAPESPHSAGVKEVAERVLNAEIQSGAGYQSFKSLYCHHHFDPFATL
jgi:hypothetical protein